MAIISRIYAPFKHILNFGSVASDDSQRPALTTKTVSLVSPGEAGKCEFLRLATADILRSYRMRWQIELAFKRPEEPCSTGYGELLVALLAQKLIRIGRDYFPSGYPLSEEGTM
jgi:hypothetical protein